MSASRTSLTVAIRRGALLACLGVAVSGCATHSLDRARHDFHAGRLEQADATLTDVRIPKRDRVLFLMERGTIRQAIGDYEGSSRDFIDAYDLLVELETYSLSRGAGSLVINDTIKQFVGAPFERTLLHAMTAKNHFARGDWDNAAVEARRILQSLDEEHRRNYPDEPYSRYLAGLAFEMIDDPSNAALQYRLADELLERVSIDHETGRLSRPPPPPPPAETNGTDQAVQPKPVPERKPEIDPSWTDELVVIAQLGRMPPGGTVIGAVPRYAEPLYAEIYADGRYLGRSYLLSDTVYLRAETDRVRALREAAKTISRIAIKEGIAIAVEANNNELAGDLVRLILIGLLEQPDLRSWDTLPRWFHVARVPAPPGLTHYTVHIKGGTSGETIRTIDVQQPLQRRRNRTVSFFRDGPARP